ncbi:MAG: RNA-binding transcriptional accessory protein [Dehalococcoidia bacterium]|nr:RNA-binding transcriptional accessory protein [Dehalococcoidia bacterium]
MIESDYHHIANTLGTEPWQVKEVEALLKDGATIPFIARYRKERTGSLDEVIVTGIRDMLAQLASLNNRREAILNSLVERGLLTDDLSKSIQVASTITALEDIYLPYRPKRRTRATIAREKGLEALARLLYTQSGDLDPEKEAAVFVDESAGVTSVEEALAGARDIMAEWISEDIEIRQIMRELFEKNGIMFSKAARGKENEGIKYQDYFNRQEPVAKIPGHRILAIFRGENQGMLSVTIRPEEEKALSLLQRRLIKGNNESAKQVLTAMEDSYMRLIAPSLENDVRHKVKERADAEALKVFASNIRNQLMSPPLGQKVVLAIDPGYRTGCKVVCLDRQGNLMHSTTIYIEQSRQSSDTAKHTLRELVGKFNIDAVAIGNGTAGRETEEFVRSIGLTDTVQILMVNESGASIYSASQVAREEFPDVDLTVRGAVSIGRRLLDPLAELVKIDPRSIGVGQYQHDVDQVKLKTRLDDVVISCVNEVGVEANTASKQLLSYVSGLGPMLANNIFEYRKFNGPFRSLNELRKVPRLGPKAYEQAAGFLRIQDGENPLDASAVHPENYSLVSRIANDLGCISVAGLINNLELLKKIDPSVYIEDGVGLPTLTDILAELSRPGRDPRKRFEVFSFTAKIKSIDNLKQGMVLPGIITNVTNFGAFVDIGVHQDGLIHISQLSDKFVKDPTAIVKINQRVAVTVLNIDIERKRISLALKTQ